MVPRSFCITTRLRQPGIRPAQRLLHGRPGPFDNGNEQHGSGLAVYAGGAPMTWWATDQHRPSSGFRYPVELRRPRYNLTALSNAPADGRHLRCVPARRRSCQKSAYGADSARSLIRRSFDNSLTFTPSARLLGNSGRCQPKSHSGACLIHYGRMNATLGVEIPRTNLDDPDDDPLRLHRSAHRDYLNCGARPSSGRSLTTAWTPMPSTSTCSTCR